MFHNQAMIKVLSDETLMVSTSAAWATAADALGKYLDGYGDIHWQVHQQADHHLKSFLDELEYREYLRGGVDFGQTQRIDE